MVAAIELGILALVLSLFLIFMSIALSANQIADELSKRNQKDNIL